jgi:hypothetical protein
MAIDEYFSSWEDIEDSAEENGLSLDGMLLVMCKPINLHCIPDDEWCDDLAEDGELPCDVAEAVDKLNDVLKETSPMSFIPGEMAVIIPHKED